MPGDATSSSSISRCGFRMALSALATSWPVMPRSRLPTKSVRLFSAGSTSHSPPFPTCATQRVADLHAEDAHRRNQRLLARRLLLEVDEAVAGMSVPPITHILLSALVWRMRATCFSCFSSSTNCSTTMSPTGMRSSSTFYQHLASYPPCCEPHRSHSSTYQSNTKQRVPEHRPHEGTRSGPGTSPHTTE